MKAILEFLNCSPFSYWSSNFAIAKVVTLNLFALIFVLVLLIGSWLLFYIALHIVIALPNLSLFYVLKGDSKKYQKSFPLRARKRDNYCYCDSWNSNNFRERNKKWYSYRKKNIIKEHHSHFWGTNNIFADCSLWRYLRWIYEFNSNFKLEILWGLE